MVILKSFLFLMYAFLITTSSKATHSEELDAKNFTSSPIISAVQNLYNEIKQSQKNADIHHIKIAYKKFKEITYTPDQWKDIAAQFKAHKWPAQTTWQEAVGGHLFYPTNIDELMESPYRKHLSKRGDMVWSLIMAAKFNHTLGEYHLAYILDKAHTAFIIGKKPKIIQTLYTKAFDDLKKENTSEAFYILARNYTDCSYKVGVLEFNIENALALHTKGTDACNKFYSLMLRDKYSLIEGEPTLGEYEKIAENYLPTYLYLADKVEDFEIKLKYLEKAIGLNYVDAFYKLSDLYHEQDNLIEAKNVLIKAKEAGHNGAYMRIAKLILGKREGLAFNKDVKQLSSHALIEAEKALEGAIIANDSRGLEYLAVLKYQQDKKEQMVNFLEKGVKLGSVASYQLAAKILTPDSFSRLVKRYGDPYDHPEFLKKLEKFL